MDNKFEKANGGFFGIHMPGMNRYFIGSSGVGTMASAINAGQNFMNGAWDENPNKFQQLGSDTGDMVGEASMFGMSAVMGMQHLRTLGKTSGYYHNGTTYQKLAAGGWEGIGKGVVPEETMKGYMAKAGKDSFAVNVKNGAPFKSGWKGFGSRIAGTYKPMGMKGNLYMMGAQIAVGLTAKLALGFAGKVLDEAYSESRHFRKPQYDNRFFNTQKEDQSSYQQLGAAMESYENKMMSVARIYHSRG